MSSDKESFTEGPWQVCECDEDNYQIDHIEQTEEYGKITGTIAETYSRENAFLIASAPEMYACLKEIVNLASSEKIKGEDVYIRDFTKIRKILQKARGE